MVPSCLVLLRQQQQQHARQSVQAIRRLNHKSHLVVRGGTTNSKRNIHTNTRASASSSCHKGTTDTSSRDDLVFVAAAAASTLLALSAFPSVENSSQTSKRNCQCDTVTNNDSLPLIGASTNAHPQSSTNTSSSKFKLSSKNQPRNVMVHRLRSLRGRSLNEKYNVEWKQVLGEGAYGSVHPARLAATGEKVRKITSGVFKWITDFIFSCDMIFIGLTV